MKPESLQVLQHPISAERFDLIDGTSSQSGHGPALRGVKSHETFIIQDGIPIFNPDGTITGMNQKYQKMYNHMAAFYDLSTTLYALLKSGGERARRMEYLSELEIRPGDRVLETSIGTGANVVCLPPSAVYYGIDISWGMLKQCQKKSRRAKRPVELFLCGAENLCFQDETFNVVFHVGGINYFNDRKAAISEMVRVAKPGSKLIIADETEQLAQRYENTPGASGFYKNREGTISTPVDLLPAGMKEVEVKLVGGGDLYCLSFRKP